MVNLILLIFLEKAPVNQYMRFESSIDDESPKTPFDKYESGWKSICTFLFPFIIVAELILNTNKNRFRSSLEEMSDFIWFNKFRTCDSR